MSSILLVIVAGLVIWRLVKIGQMIVTQDFVVGLLSLIAFVFFFMFWWSGLNTIEILLDYLELSFIQICIVVVGLLLRFIKLSMYSEEEQNRIKKYGKYILIAGLILSAKDLINVPGKIIDLFVYDISIVGADKLFIMIFYEAVPCAVLVGITCLVNKVGILKNRRIEVPGPWAILSGALMLVSLYLIVLIQTNFRISGLMINLIVLPGIILMYLFKPFRVPWFILLNVLMLGLVAAKVDQGSFGDDGFATDISDGGNDMSVVEASKGTTFTEFDAAHVVDGVNGESYISTHNEDMSFAASMNISNDTASITKDVINNNAVPSDSVTVSSMDGKDRVILQDNKIYDGTNMQVGTYGTDVSNGNIAFKDTAGNNLGSIDPNTGFTYDETGKQAGSVQNLGAVTTYTDADGHQAYKSNLDGAPVIDSKTGELIATVKKN